MSKVDIILNVYGFLLLTGAYFGVKAGSKVSLYMGLGSGALVFIGLHLAKTNPTVGYELIAALSAILVIVFGIRLAKTKKMMPSGMLLLTSLIALFAAIKALKF